MAMRRREFIAGLGGAAAWPIAARAQLETPTVGCLINGSPRDTESLIAPFHNGLRVVNVPAGATPPAFTVPLVSPVNL
jgi:putative ABC transport system substrate-binding protein